MRDNKKSIIALNDIESYLVEVLTQKYIRWIQVQALVSYEQRNDAKDFGFGWDKENKIWTVFMTPEQAWKLMNSKSVKKTFEVKFIGYKFHDKTYRSNKDVFAYREWDKLFE